MKVANKLKTGLKSKKIAAVKKQKKPLKERAKTEVNGVKKSLKKKKVVNDETPAVIKKSAKKIKVAEKEQKKKKPLEKKKKKPQQMPDIEGIKKIDPEFYNFLKQNDKKLLEFNFFDSDDSEDEQDQQASAESKKKSKATAESDEEEEDSEKFHKPTADELEVASDESDFEDEDEKAAGTGAQKITLNLLRQWQSQLEAPNVSMDVVRRVIQAFNASLASLAAEESEPGQGGQATPFKVVGPAIFNGVIQLCVLHLQPAIWRVLGVQAKSSQPLHKYKKWVKLRSCLRYYLTDLAQLIQQISSPNILGVLLKHLHQMAPVVCCYTGLGKIMLKRLITLWSTEDETVRVLAFLCILKITRSQQNSMLHHVLKAMYLSYVRNSKFVSPNTLPSINFMRRSLVEMFALDLQVAYQHAFLYIRQLAIHLRNAVVLKKKDSFQAVYNWQFVNSLRLWSELLGATAYKPQLQPLIYPLVTIICGVVRLIPTAQYFPLRFHCVQQLVSLSKTTNVYIPLLPFVLEVLRSNTFNRKHTKVSMRPMPFTCILRLNKTQLTENGFRDETVEQVVALSLEYLAHESASLAFSDLVVPTVLALKAYLKQCHNANYSRKLKQLLDKIQENSAFINRERQKLTCGLKDLAQVQAWEAEVRNKGTPLDIYYNSWVKTHETKKRRQAAQADKVNTDYGLPSIKKQQPKNSVAVRDENGKVELFPGSDSEDDLPFGADDEHMEEEQEEEVVEAPVKKRSKKEKRKPVVKEVAEEAEMEVEENGTEEVDIVKDLDLDDW